MWHMKIKRWKRLPVEIQTDVAREGWVDGETD